MGKAERLRRERKTMDAATDYIENFDPESYSSGTEFYSCSLQIEHDENCDGDCITMDRYDVAIFIEERRWAISGLQTNKIGANTFISDMRINSLHRLFVEKGLLTEEEIQEYFKITLLETLKTLRPRMVQAAAEQRARQAIAVPQGAAPNGKPVIYDGFGRPME